MAAILLTICHQKSEPVFQYRINCFLFSFPLPQDIRESSFIKLGTVTVPYDEP